MIGQQRVLGLITARGGSKGLPGKNTRLLCGRPLIAWTVDAARASSCLDAVVVSTDDAGIAEAARAAGAEVPFLRPAALASDTASSIDAVLHALDTLAAEGREFQVLVLLEPTSPLREASDIDAAVQQLATSGADAVVSVCRAEGAHPSFMFRMDERGAVTPYLTVPPTGVRRQDIEPLFYLEGTVYVSTVAALRETRAFCHDRTVAYEVPKWKALEIDDEDDFVMVQAIAKHRGWCRE